MNLSIKTTRKERIEKKRRYREYQKKRAEAGRIRELFNPQARYKLLKEMQRKKDFNKQYNMMINILKKKGGKKNGRIKFL